MTNESKMDPLFLSSTPPKKVMVGWLSANKRDYQKPGKRDHSGLKEPKRKLTWNKHEH